MKKNYFSILVAVLLMSAGLHAQAVNKGVVFTTGGSFMAPNNTVKLYTLNFPDLTNWVIDSITGDFSNKVVVETHYAYVHVGRAGGHPDGADRIYKYDLTNQSAGAIDSTEAIAGIQDFAISGNNLVITRGYPATSEYVEVVDKNDLSTSVYTDNSIMGSCNGVVVMNQKAYISATNFGVGGVVHVFDLGTTISFVGSIQCDTLSLGANQIMAENGKLYMTNLRYRPDYSVWYAGVTSIDLSDSSFVTDTAGLGSATAFDFYNGNILGNFGSPLETYDVNTGTVSPVFAFSATAALREPNGMGYAIQSTDYFSYGKVELVNNSGMVGVTVNTDISGSAMAGMMNNIPMAVNDTLYGGSLTGPVSFYIDALANDYDMDNDSLTIDSILSQPSLGSLTIENNQIKFESNTGGNVLDTVSYVMSDVWGDADTARVILSLIGSVESVKEDVVSVYPNPSNDVVNLSTIAPIQEVVVMDVFGKVIELKYPLSDRFVVDVKDWSKGVYFITVKVNDKIETHRLMVQ